ncbi:MAG TPA: formate dehydrogenase-N subunit alpha [Firmicutes bacterium]|nr:formate dehydrogenase-N subunit alpha [Bacillota bacterium]
MTNHWIDYQNSDVFINIGGNTAENHPISMKWIEKARETKGAKLIVVDPRISRTAAVADLYVSIRPGTNIAYLGGLINYILNNERYHKEYVENYTNASYLVNEEFSFDEATGLFSGSEDDPVRSAKKYNTETWQYQRDEEGNPLKDPTLQDPNCVFQLMKKHYAKYTIDNVSKVTGADPEALEASYELYSSTGEPGKAGNLLYAMGITQFTHGSQNVRACAVVQLLLGNMGIAGGGVNAQRGQSNVQGSTDMAILYHIIPGYMSTPQQAAHPTLADYLEKETPASGWWVNKPKYFVSLLKAFYGDSATRANEFGYQWMPKLDGLDHSHIAGYRDMGEGKVEGMICWADNPAVSGPSAANKRNYQKNLKWLVSVDLFENETASFWEGPGMDPAEIDTEVFILPAAAGYEREGSKANSGRWIQWTWKCQDPPGEAKSDLWIVNELFKKLQALYEAEGGAVPDQITKMQWDYDGPDGEVDIVKVCKEINGYRTSDGSLVTNFVGLADDGSTVCGNWLYSGYYNNLDNPATKNRTREKEGIGSNLGWSFAWPLNRRIVYNRGSADLEGKPWNPDAPVVWWDELQQKWVGNDIPDIPGSWTLEQSTENPFIMLPEGVGRLYSHSALKDGPLPTHYEPAESLVPNLFYPNATYNPVSQRFYEDHTVETDEERARYPYIITTYRIVEHYQSGIVTRNLPWLNELMPELFIEISEELASELGISNGDTVAIESKRLFKDGNQDSIEAKACVTRRLKPLVINGEKKHFVGMPWHWGFKGMNTGAVANDLTASVGDANTTIPESKAFLCNIRRAG